MSVESVGIAAAGGPFALMLLNVLDEYAPKKINKTELFHVLIEVNNSYFSVTFLNTIFYRTKCRAP